MFDLLEYLLKQGTATQAKMFPQLDDACLGLPRIDPEQSCQGAQCNECASICPTNAIKVIDDSKDSTKVTLDLGACIGCGLCISSCPTNLFVRDLRTTTASKNISSLIISNSGKNNTVYTEPDVTQQIFPFRRSLAVRVVSTGCSACDLEVSAAGNPIFDLERFGIHIVASPRAADALLVTGPVGSAMQAALRRTYDAMAEPRLVIAAGTCAISGGIHSHGYAEANGVGAILPVDVSIPGCPPHPWSIIHGLMLAMGRNTA